MTMAKNHILVVNMCHVIGSRDIAQWHGHAIFVVIGHVLVPQLGPFLLHTNIKGPWPCKIGFLFHLEQPLDKF